MTLEIWQLIVGILGSLGLGTLVTWLLNKRQYNAAVVGQEQKNVQSENDLFETLKETAEKAVKKEFDKNKELQSLKTQFDIEARSRALIGEQLVNLAKEIGGFQKAEEICQKELSEIKQREREREILDRKRDEERYAEMRKLFSGIEEKLDNVLCNSETG